MMTSCPPSLTVVTKKLIFIVSGSLKVLMWLTGGQLKGLGTCSAKPPSVLSIYI